MLYLVAYDIAEPSRLRRVARALERHALRCQKSVFLFRGDQAAVEALLDLIAPRLHPDEDVVQAWKLALDQPAAGLVRGSPPNVRPAAVILDAAGRLFVHAPTP
jgi:CRISPR-associated endonuclease Cas2